MRALVLVESNTTGTGRLFARAAGTLGFRPVLLAADPGRYPWAAEDGVETIVCATGDPAAVLDACRALARRDGLAGVTSSSDYFVATAARAARRLRLPAPSATAIERCRNKRRQRQVLAAAGVPCPWFRAVKTPEQAVRAATGRVAVLKPVWGSGSVGVRQCGDAREVHAHAAALLAHATNERGIPVPQELLVEELVLGPEFSVETFGLRVVGVTAKHLAPPPSFVEIGHDFPAAVPAKVRAALERVTLRALRALGLGWGPAHTELRLAAKGPVIIEVNPRLAGGFIPELVRRAVGVDLVTETVRLATGGRGRVTPTRRGAASIRFVVPGRAGVLAGCRGLTAARALPGVEEARLYAAVGSPVAPRGDFRDRVGHVLAVGADVGQSGPRADAALARVELQVAAPGARVRP